MNCTARKPTPQAILSLQNELQRFVECLFDPGDIVEVRRLPSGRSSWYADYHLPTLAARLIRDNQRGENIYLGINPRREPGGRSAADVECARTLFCDFDNVTADCVRARTSAMPEPTLIVASGGGFHCYWRLIDPIHDLLAWSALQRRLIALVGSDPAIHDPPRIMRLPGLLNNRRGRMAAVIDADPRRVHRLADLAAALPPLPSPTPARPPSAPRTAGCDAAARAARKAKKWEGVSKGNRNRTAMRRAAELVIDFDLTDADAWVILTTWNQKNVPPLGEVELGRCLASGRRYGKREAGCAL